MTSTTPVSNTIPFSITIPDSVAGQSGGVYLAMFGNLQASTGNVAVTLGPWSTTSQAM